MWLYFEQIPDNFEFPMWYNIFATVFQAIFAYLTMKVNLRVLTFLKRKVGRYVNTIIDVHVKISLFLTPITFMFMTNLHFAKQLNGYVPDVWCYFSAYAGYFFFYYNSSHSFVIAIFRYICVLHPDKVSKLGSNAPKVRIIYFLNLTYT